MNVAADAPTQAAASLTVGIADYMDPRDAGDVVELLDAYARDPIGGGEPLRAEVRERLIAGLVGTPGAFSVLVRIGDEAVGLANCFMGYSTFAAAPLVNIHDLVVVPGHRGRGVGKALLTGVEVEATRRGACKITLEVLSGNEPAKALYSGSGFQDYQLDPAAGYALCWQKTL